MGDSGQQAPPVGRRTVLLAAGALACGAAGCSAGRPHATASGTRHAEAPGRPPPSAGTGTTRTPSALPRNNVGGPVLLGGGTPGQFFSDATHHDHVHLGFRA
ncbi:hypothetical protein [Streptomyces sediminimaris]|uniref:hypothetical protein n=1 Tax=Streptomyces sediminimaris TaxID=3383721 RepID=UPI00399B8164